MEIGSGTKKDDHLVQFGCSYSVRVQASPIIPPARPQIVNITVPGYTFSFVSTVVDVLYFAYPRACSGRK